MAKEQYRGTGRRKSSVARVVIEKGKGKITINGRDVKDYMPYETLVIDLKQPLTLTGNLEKYDVNVNVYGGGFTGQAGAIRHGIARALLLAVDRMGDFDRNMKDTFSQEEVTILLIIFNVMMILIKILYS